MNADDAATRFGSGRAVPRIEDAALLAGRGRFVDNLAVAGQAVVAFQRSPYAHAHIVSIDVDAARSMPGVLAVFTGADLVAAGVKPMPANAGFKRADGVAAGPDRHAPRARDGALRRRGGRRCRRRIARSGA